MSQQCTCLVAIRGRGLHAVDCPADQPAPDPSAAEQAVIERFGIFAEEEER